MCPGQSLQSKSMCRGPLLNVPYRCVISFPCSDAVLVGHSMENDLMALKVVHRRIIDTGIHSA